MHIGSRRRGQSAVLAAIAALALFSAACGNTGGGQGSSDGQTGANAGGSGSGGGASGDSGGSGGGSDDGGFGWVPFGPADPTSPTPDWAAYHSLALHQCDIGTPSDDQSDGHLWHALDALCDAAVQGDDSQWTVARTEFEAATGKYFIYSDCLAEQASSLLTRGLAWHDAHPGKRPHIDYPRASGETACGEQFRTENGGGSASESTDTTDTSESTESTDTSTESTQPSG